jgi:hypothetical protein
MLDGSSPSRIRLLGIADAMVNKDRNTRNILFQLRNLMVLGSSASSFIRERSGFVMIFIVSKTMKQGPGDHCHLQNLICVNFFVVLKGIFA